MANPTPASKTRACCGPITLKSSGAFLRIRLILDVNARRLGSDLDSIIEVLDAQGRPIERAVVRPVWETATTLAERDSSSRGLRILTWNALSVGDRLMVGGEVLQVAALPQGPDSDLMVESLGGQRLAYYDTSTEAHAVDNRRAAPFVHVINGAVDLAMSLGVNSWS